MSKSHELEPGNERITRSAARNPRRRPRPSENDNTLPVQPPKRRRRNEIKDETFHPRDSIENGEYDGNIDNIKLPNGHIHHPLQNGTTGGSRSNSATHHQDTPMTIRGKPKRAMRGDGATTLAQNQCYTVKMLPSTPKELRKEGLKYRGSLGNSGYALAVTHEKAIVWDYTAHLAAASPRAFNMPFPSKNDGPLPFGALISNGASTLDQGLVLIAATTGKVIFYDSIERAASLGLFQDRKNGVEGSIGPLFSGETLVDLVPADFAGFVVVLSSGRIAQLTLRDAQGKPSISCQFLRATETSSGGLFGSFGRLWNGGFRKDLTAVRIRPLSIRGQMQTVALTEKAEILLWNIDWSGRSEFRGKFDFRETLVGELKALELPESQGKADAITILDFAILEAETTGQEITLAGADQLLSMLSLLRVGGNDMHTYALAELCLSEEKVQVTRIIQLLSHKSTNRTMRQSRPKLTLPKPGHTAFITFEDATILVAAHPFAEESPEAQLHASFTQPDSYEDVIYLRPDRHFAITSAWNEPARGNQASSIVFVEGAGLVRISAAADASVSTASPKISAQSTIESAVYYGALQENIIDFSRTGRSTYTLEQVEEAALLVSRQILLAETSHTGFISPSPTSMEQHLATKAKALKALVDYLRQNHPALSQATMWKLVWDAERLAAGQQLWIAFEEHVAMSMENGKRKATLLDELCDWFVQQNDHFTQRPEIADEDPVRKFFIAGLNHEEHLLRFARIILQDLRTNQEKTPEHILRFVGQANDIWVRILGTVFEFRMEHLAEYGIVSEVVDGILTDISEYVDLPEFWTSTETLVNGTISVTNLSREFATEFYDLGTMSEASEYARDIAHANPQLVQLYCLQAQESINWRSSRDSQKDKENAKVLKLRFDENRYQLCRHIAAVGLAESGMRLAEKYKDMHTLSDMVLAEEQYLEEELAKKEIARPKFTQHQGSLQSKIQRYFDKYGTEWANEFFGKLFSGVDVGVQLEHAQTWWGKPLTEYLRSDPSRAKICWINDVTKEQSYAHAGEVLAQSAESQESRLWAKKVELSMSKLALMAAEEGGESITTLKPSNDARINLQSDLVIVSIQEKLYNHLALELYGLLDRTAEMEHCMQAFGDHAADWPALHQLLEGGFNMVLDHTALSLEQLIDVLTLMDLRELHDMDTNDNMRRSEFFNALVALDAAAPNITSTRFETLLQVIWKRCYIYNDWTEIKFSGQKTSDAERQRELRLTTLWHTFYYCLENGYMDTPGRQVRILTPSQCLGSACQVQDLAYRFPTEDLLNPILHDCQVQDELLQSYVTDRKLDEVATECMRDVTANFQQSAEALANIAERERAREQEFEQKGAMNGNGLDQQEAFWGNGHMNGTNGYAADLLGAGHEDADTSSMSIEEE